MRNFLLIRRTLYAWLNPLPLLANGSCSHIHISQIAVEKLPPGPLRTLLEDPVNIPTPERGSMFPSYAVEDDDREHARWSADGTARRTVCRLGFAG